MSSPKWRIKLSEACLKDFKKLDHTARKRILQYLNRRLAFAEKPQELGKPLRHELKGLWRFRIAGTYRALCEIQEDQVLILVLKVGHRRDVYE